MKVYDHWYEKTKIFLSEENINQLLKWGGKKLLIDLLINIILHFKAGVSWTKEVCEFCGWKLIFLSTFFVKLQEDFWAHIRQQ